MRTICANLMEYVVQKHCFGAVAQNGGWGAGGLTDRCIAVGPEVSSILRLQPVAVAVAAGSGAAAKHLKEGLESLDRVVVLLVE